MSFHIHDTIWNYELNSIEKSNSWNRLTFVDGREEKRGCQALLCISCCLYGTGYYLRCPEWSASPGRTIKAKTAEEVEGWDCVVGLCTLAIGRCNCYYVSWCFLLFHWSKQPQYELGEYDVLLFLYLAFAAILQRLMPNSVRQATALVSKNIKRRNSSHSNVAAQTSNGNRFASLPFSVLELYDSLSYIFPSPLIEPTTAWEYVCYTREEDCDNWYWHLPVFNCFKLILSENEQVVE